MTQSVPVPLWLLLLMGLATLWALLDRLLLPSVRWFLRSRANRVLREIRNRLRIEIRPFQLTRRRVLVDRLVYDPRVTEAALAYAEAERVPIEVAMERVERYAREIVPAFNAYFYFRLGYWVARGLARVLYRVRLAWADEEGLAAVPPSAAVVFVVNHRSNMDYILVAYLAATRTALSYAVGEWARVWPLESLLKAMGAYFVRRGSRNALYRRVLERYVQMATEAGVPQVVFPEGGLSRDGSLCPPKLGLLDYMARGFDPAGERDVVFVPVGINYDRTLEDRTLLAELESDRVAPSLARALGTTVRFFTKYGWQRLTGRGYRFGYACVSFGTPLSLREHVAESGVDFRRLPREQRFEEVGRLGQRLMDRIGRLVPVTPVALVASVLVRHGGPISELDLQAEAWSLMAAMREAGARVYVPRADEGYAVTVGLRMLRLRRLIEGEEGSVRVVAGQEEVVAYYARSVEQCWPEEAEAARVGVG